MTGLSQVDALLPVVAMIAVSATIVDVSPFSGNGAAVIANATPDAREQVYRTQLRYGGLVVLLAPLLIWLAVVVPAWGLSWRASTLGRPCRACACAAAPDGRDRRSGVDEGRIWP